MFSVSYFRTLSQAKQTGEITEYSDEYKAIEDAVAERLYAKRHGMLEIIPTMADVFKPRDVVVNYIPTT